MRINSLHMQPYDFYCWAETWFLNILSLCLLLFVNIPNIYHEILSLKAKGLPFSFAQPFLLSHLWRLAVPLVNRNPPVDNR